VKLVHEEDPGRDPELGALLAAVSGEAPVNEVDWEALRQRTVERAQAAKVERRSLRRRVRAFLGTAMAASVALLFMLTRSGDVGGGASLSGDPTLDEILASDVSDEELRALLAGAGGVEALLLLAASEDER
jgi:hypothetical protein